MKLYMKYLVLHLKSQLQYKISFALSCLSQVFIFFTYYFVIIALFSKFDNVNGFTLYEIMLTYSVILFGFSFVEFSARGIDKFDKLIIKGGFDRILIRPRNVLLQVLGEDIKFMKITKTIQALIILAIAVIKIDISWDILKVMTLLLMMLFSIIIFYSIFILTASYCFFTIEGLESTNAIKYGGKEAAQYPAGIFKKGFAAFLTFVIPFAFINYYPLLYLTGRSSNILYAFSPILVTIFFVISLLCFKFGTKRYASTGS